MGVELFGGPLEVTVDPRAAVQLEEVVSSLSRMEREMVKVAMADQRVASAAEELSKQFRAEFITAEQVRQGLSALAGELPKTAAELRKAAAATEEYTQKYTEWLAAQNSRAFWIQQNKDAEALRAMRSRDAEAFRSAMAKYERDNTRLGRSLTALENHPAFRRLSSAAQGFSSAFSTAFRHVRDGASSVESALSRVQRAASSAASHVQRAFAGNDIAGFGRSALHGAAGVAPYVLGAGYAGMHAVEHVAERTSEFQRLRRIQEELGVNFAQAQGASDRFVSQTDIAGLTEHFASAHVNLSQQQMGALTRGAARMAQMNGTSFDVQSERLFSAIVGGELEVLRKLGPEMAALSGQTHTAQERLETFVRTVQGLGRPAEDAATAVERFKESVAQAERAFFGNFVAELTNTAGEGGVFTETNRQLEAMQRSMLGIESGAHAIESVGTMLGGIFGTWASGIRLAINALNTFYSGMLRLTVLNPLRTVNDLTGGALGRAARNVIGTAAHEVAPRAQQSQTADMTFSQSEAAHIDRLADQDTENSLEMATASTRKANDPMHFTGGWRPTRHGGGRGRIQSITDKQQLSARAFQQALANRGQSARANRARNAFFNMPSDVDSDTQRYREAKSFMREDELERGIDPLTAMANARTDRTVAGSLGDLFEGQPRGDLDHREQDARDAAERTNAESMRRAAELERQSDLAVRLFDRQRDAAKMLGDTIVSAYDDGSKALAEFMINIAGGADEAGQALQEFAAKRLQAIAVEAGGQALQSGAEAIYYAFTAPHIAVSKALAAAKFAAIAGGAAVGSFALAPVDENAGKGRRRRMQSDMDGDRHAADISASRRSRSSADNGPNITIQFGAPVVAGNPAQAGRMIANMVRDAIVREGVRIPSLMANA